MKEELELGLPMAATVFQAVTGGIVNVMVTTTMAVGIWREVERKGGSGFRDTESLKKRKQAASGEGEVIVCDIDDWPMRPAILPDQPAFLG